MDNYKSWSGLNKFLTDSLCDELKGRITYFLTRYHAVHNSYGRAAVRLDGKELVCFSWIDMYYQERDLAVLFKENPDYSDYSDDSDERMRAEMKSEWDRNCTYCEMDFLEAALRYRNISIDEALNSESFIIRIFAILDKRVGKRSLVKIKESGEYADYPSWIKQFYKLRLRED